MELSVQAGAYDEGLARGRADAIKHCLQVIRDLKQPSADACWNDALDEAEEAIGSIHFESAGATRKR